MPPASRLGPPLNLPVDAGLGGFAPHPARCARSAALGFAPCPPPLRPASLSSYRSSARLRHRRHWTTTWGAVVVVAEAAAAIAGAGGLRLSSVIPQQHPATLTLWEQIFVGVGVESDPFDALA